jgi:G3E family GTPase
MQPAQSDAQSDTRVPVSVLTGFLGSGKTTVLRHVLRNPAFADTAVLINEFGEVGLDHLLVGRLDDAPVLLENGCICCSIRGDLSRAMRDLQARAQRGAIPPFRRVVVETTGLADPVPILATIASDLVLRRHFRLGNVVATVDAVHAEHGLEVHGELLKQAAVADRLLLTKTDLVSDAQVDRLRGMLRRVNPAATVGVAVNGRVDPDLVLRQGIHDPETKLAEVRRWLQARGDAEAAVFQPSHAAVGSFVLTHDRPLDWNAFGLWFSLLVHRHGGRLLRVKGILSVEGSATPVAVHAVQHLMHAPEHLPAWPTPARTSRLVFITIGLDGERVQRSLSTFCRLGQADAGRLAADEAVKPNPHQLSPSSATYSIQADCE